MLESVLDFLLANYFAMHQGYWHAQTAPTLCARGGKNFTYFRGVGTVSGDYLWRSAVLWILIGFNANPDSNPGQKIEILEVLKRIIDFFQKLQYIFRRPIWRTSSSQRENIQHLKTVHFEKMWIRIATAHYWCHFTEALLVLNVNICINMVQYHTIHIGASVCRKS